MIKKMCEPFFPAATTTFGTPFNLIMLRPEPLWLHNEHTPLAGPPGSHLVPVTADHTTTPGVSKILHLTISQLKFVARCLFIGSSKPGNRMELHIVSMWWITSRDKSWGLIFGEVNSWINHKITIIINLSGSRFTSFDPSWLIMMLCKCRSCLHWWGCLVTLAA